MDKLAAELNAVIEDKPVYRLLSDLGKRMYFPKGIISQSAEAKRDAYKYNATIGMAMEDGQTMFIPSMRKLVNGLSATEMFAYAPTAGLPELRQIWMMEMIRKNPSLVNKTVSMPIITSGLTHGLSIVSDLFIDENDDVYILFSIQTAMAYLGVCKNTAIKLYAELDSKTGIGLIDRIDRGQGRADKIYVRRIELPKDAKENERVKKIQDRRKAIKEYVRRKDKNIPLLMDYAEKFNVKETIKPYLEVLL